MSDGSSSCTLGNPLRRRVAGALSRSIDRLAVYRTLLGQELGGGPSVDLPWRRHLWLWRHGFTSRADPLFDPDEGNHRDFISDVQHELADDATEPWDGLLNNKLAFYLLFGAYDEHLPDLYGLIDRGVLKRVSPTLAAPPWATGRTDEKEGPEPAAPERVEAHAWIDDYLDERDALVLKPVYGQGGRDVLICRQDGTGEGYRVNDHPKTVEEFGALVNGLEEYLA